MLERATWPRPMEEQIEDVSWHSERYGRSMAGCRIPDGGHAMSYIKDESRKNWTHDESNNVTFSEINTGALLRIADAVEKIAFRYDELIRQRDCAQNEVTRLRGIRTKLERSNASLRGHLKRAKKTKEQ